MNTNCLSTALVLIFTIYIKENKFILRHFNFFQMMLLIQRKNKLIILVSTQQLKLSFKI